MCEVSVVIPSYNRASQIESCISNLLNQSFEDFEIVVVDDGSTDNTEAVVNNVPDQRIVYIKCIENKGACHARNVGVKYAKGNYIAFQDSDDWWEADKLQKQLKYLKETNVDMVICKLKRHRKVRNRFFPDGCLNYIGLEQILYKNYGSTQTFFVKKSCFDNELIHFDETMPRYQDWDFLINFISHGYSVALLNEVLVSQHVGNNTISSSHGKGADALKIILSKYKDYYADNPNLTAYIHYLLGTHLSAQGIYSDEFKKSFNLGYRSYKCVLKCIFCECRRKKWIVQN